jgi:creatinine amidohydrolase
MPRGVLLEDLTWIEAEGVLTPTSIVVLPIGASSKEHGPHLKLKNDWILAEHWKRCLLERADIVVAPTIGFHYYPAFTEYPGSISLRLETARDLVIDICRSLARFGPRRFYGLNTGVSTVRALAPAAEALAAEGVLLRYTDIGALLGPLKKTLCEQEGGTHADEAETSMMLVIDPLSVDMSKAVKDFHEDRPGGLTRDAAGAGTYSPTGIWGDPTLASRAKGEALVNAFLEGLLRDIDALRGAALPGSGA